MYLSTCIECGVRGEGESSSMGSLLAAQAGVDTVNKVVGELSRQPSGFFGARYFLTKSK
jgi:hypothetical protein